MKRIQIGFAAVIAVLAMSFTIAEHNGAFKPKRLADDCFKAGGTNGLVVKATDCSTNTITISTTSTCGTAAVNQHIWSLDLNNVIASSQISANCPGGTVFCCLQVTPESALTACSDQPTFNIDNTTAKKYKVSAVFCKS